MFEITIRCETLADAERVLACLKHDHAPAAAQMAQQIAAPQDAGEGPATAPKKRGRPRKTDAAPAPATEPAAPAAELAEPPAAEQTHTFEDVKAALKALLGKYQGDMAVPLQVLGQFGAERISAVKEADYAAFLAACKAA